MEKMIRNLFNDSILMDAAGRYGADKGSLRFIGGFESIVYEFTKNNKPYIMKFTHTRKRSVNFLLGELEFIRFLDGHGISVSRPLTSLSGKNVEPLDASIPSFLAVCYEKANGHPVTEKEWNKELFAKWGETLGKIHSAAKSFSFSKPLYKRKQWHEVTELNVARFAPDEDKIIERCRQLTDYVHSLPKNRDSFGLIHGDMHHMNFFVDHRMRLTVFDFDGLEYSWFISDIAVVLYFALRWSPLQQQLTPDFYRRFFYYFWSGYLKENHLDAQWLNQIPYFLKLRHIINYVAVIRFFNPNSTHTTRLAGQLKHEIKHDLPVIDFDFSRI